MSDLEVLQALAFVGTLNRLRANEGSSVTLCCDNPEGSGPNNAAVEVVDEWTNWQPRRFYGSTVYAAAEAAICERQLAEPQAAPPRHPFPTAPYGNGHLLNLSNGGLCVHCGQHRGRIDTHPHHATCEDWQRHLRLRS